MAYLTAADLREGTNLWPDISFKVSEVEDARLTTEIAQASSVLDSMTGDHFESTSDTSHSYAGNDTTQLVTYSHPHLTSVASVTEVPIDGASSILYTTDRFTVRPWGIKLIGNLVFADSSNFTLTTIVYGRTAVPYDAKRAVALLVHFTLKGTNIGKHQAIRWQTPDGTVFESDPNSRTGVPELDRLVKRLSFNTPQIRWA